MAFFFRVLPVLIGLNFIVDGFKSKSLVKLWADLLFAWAAIGADILEFMPSIVHWQSIPIPVYFLVLVTSTTSFVASVFLWLVVFVQWKLRRVEKKVTSSQDTGTGVWPPPPQRPD